MADKSDPIQKALEDIAEAARSLATHGAGGYTVDTSALDAVFIRSLKKLHEAFETDGANFEWYDPYGDVQTSLMDGF